jgi:hypothetical protein
MAEFRDSMEEARRAKIALEGFPPTEEGSAGEVAGPVLGSMFSASTALASPPDGVETELLPVLAPKAVFMVKSSSAASKLRASMPPQQLSSRRMWCQALFREALCASPRVS